MSRKKIGVYGASGYGKEVMPIVKSGYGIDDDETEFLFVDDDEQPIPIMDYRILKYKQFVEMENVELSVSVAIAESKTRQMLTDRCRDSKIKIIDVRANNVVILDDVEIGPGYILNPFVTLTSGIMIGESFQANIYSYVAHDCEIGDYVTFAPGVKCNGNVKICDHAYIGTGAIIKQGKPGNPLVIGRGAVVGAGAMVTKSVPDGMTVFGNPAIEFTKENVRRRS